MRDSRCAGAHQLCHRCKARLGGRQEAGEHGTAVDAQWAARQMAQPGVDGDRIAYLCASATLLDTDNSQVRFVHQLVQEYFAALALADRLHEGDNLRCYWPSGWTQPSGWEETLILLAGMLPDMTALIERLLPVHPALAARCIAESGGERPDDATLRTVQQRLVKLMTDPRAPIPPARRGGRGRQPCGRPATWCGVACGWPARYRVGVRACGGSPEWTQGVHLRT